MARPVSSTLSALALTIMCSLLALDVALRLANFNRSELGIKPVSSCPPEKQYGNKPQDAEKQHRNEPIAIEKQHGNVPNNTDVITGAVKTLLTDSASVNQRPKKSDDDEPKLAHRIRFSKLRRTWKFNNSFEYKFDTGLATYLSSIVQWKTVLELGAGRGHYTEAFSRTAEHTHAVDGAEDIEELTSGYVKHADLTQRLDLGVYDWVVCLEMGRHVPKEFEVSLFDNIHRHNKMGVILSWGGRNQDGWGPINGQSYKYIKFMMSVLGYGVDVRTQKNARKAAIMLRFKKAIMIFRRKAKPLQ